MRKTHRHTANRHHDHVRQAVANIIAILLFAAVIYFAFT